jgi:hypothetical protein
MEESFYAPVKLIISERNKKQIRLIIMQLLELGAIDDDTADAIFLGTHCFK